MEEKTIIVKFMKRTRRFRRVVKINPETTTQDVLDQLGLYPTSHPFYEAKWSLSTLRFERIFRPDDKLFDAVSNGQELQAGRETKGPRFPLPRPYIEKTKQPKGYRSKKKKTFVVPKEQLPLNFGNVDLKMSSFSRLCEPYPKKEQPANATPESKGIDDGGVGCPLCGKKELIRRKNCYYCDHCDYSECSI